MAPQQSSTEAMKSGDPRAVDSTELFGAPFHLFRRFVGEGDGEDAVRSETTPVEVGDAMRDDACLTAPRAGEHEKRALLVQNGLSLGRIQALQAGVRVAHMREFDGCSENRVNVGSLASCKRK